MRCSSTKGTKASIAFDAIVKSAKLVVRAFHRSSIVFCSDVLVPIPESVVLSYDLHKSSETA